ncbi:MAG: hypothetical protein EAX91_11580 [Candidatus Lokiarchaeota archaeon]|nr:hypothetical protein [Candidatus Lokiarchaeota archaeon]
MSVMNSECFVIMPFSKSSEEHTEEYWTQHFEKLLKPIIEELGVKTYRVEVFREDILKKIIQSLVTSYIVVADLTDHNPNVFWELGVRQSFKHNTITIAEEGTKLPFDVSSKATIFYNLSNEEKLAQFKKNLKEAIKDCIANPKKSDSHVLESISGRGSFYDLIRLDDAKRRIESLIIETQNNIRNYNISKNMVAELKDISQIPFELRTVMWRTRCLEFLFVNRYLDEDDRFYKTTEQILRVMENMCLVTPMLNSFNEVDTNEALNLYRGRFGRAVTKGLNVWLDTLEKVYENITKRLQTMISETRLKSLSELRSSAFDADYGSFF